MKIQKGQYGLIKLLIALCVIGILIMIALPAFGSSPPTTVVCEFDKGTGPRGDEPGRLDFTFTIRGCDQMVDITTSNGAGVGMIFCAENSVTILEPTDVGSMQMTFYALKGGKAVHSRHSFTDFEFQDVTPSQWYGSCK
jgi:hypothetical protein